MSSQTNQRFSDLKTLALYLQKISRCFGASLRVVCHKATRFPSIFTYNSKLRTYGVYIPVMGSDIFFPHEYHRVTDFGSPAYDTQLTLYPTFLIHVCSIAIFIFKTTQPPPI